MGRRCKHGDRVDKKRNGWQGTRGKPLAEPMRTAIASLDRGIRIHSARNMGREQAFGSVLSGVEGKDSVAECAQAGDASDDTGTESNSDYGDVADQTTTLGKRRNETRGEHVLKTLSRVKRSSSCIIILGHVGRRENTFARRIGSSVGGNERVSRQFVRISGSLRGPGAWIIIRVRCNS